MPDGLRDVFRGMTEALSSGFHCAAVRSLKIIQVLIGEQSNGELESKILEAIDRTKNSPTGSIKILLGSGLVSNSYTTTLV